MTDRGIKHHTLSALVPAIIVVCHDEITVCLSCSLLRPLYGGSRLVTVRAKWHISLATATFPVHVLFPDFREGSRRPVPTIIVVWETSPARVIVASLIAIKHDRRILCANSHPVRTTRTVTRHETTYLNFLMLHRHGYSATARLMQSKPW